MELCRANSRAVALAEFNNRKLRRPLHIRRHPQKQTFYRFPSVKIFVFLKILCADMQPTILQYLRLGYCNICYVFLAVRGTRGRCATGRGTSVAGAAGSPGRHRAQLIIRANFTRPFYRSPIAFIGPYFTAP
jgi:hypothetical protein